jgi:hypothetical protein
MVGWMGTSLMNYLLWNTSAADHRPPQNKPWTTAHPENVWVNHHELCETSWNDLYKKSSVFGGSLPTMADGYEYHSNRLVMIIPVYHMSIECGLITGHLVWWVISWHSTSETREPSWFSHETIHHFGHPHGKILGPWRVEIHVVHSRSQMWTGKTSLTVKNY